MKIALDCFRCTYLLFYDCLLLRCLSAVLHELRIAILVLVDPINTGRHVWRLLSPRHLLHLAATLRTACEGRVLGGHRGLTVTDHLL